MPGTMSTSHLIRRAFIAFALVTMVALPQAQAQQSQAEVAGTGTTNMLPKWTDNAGTLADSRVFDDGTRIGIGTTAPQRAVHIGAGTDVPNMPGTQLYVTNPIGSSGISARDTLNDVELAIGTAHLGGGVYVGLFGSRTPHDLYLQANGSNRMVVKVNGFVGIGTLNPTTALDVVGSVNVSGNIAAKYQDVAEWVPTDEPLDGGTLVVLSHDEVNTVRRSHQAYDTSVAGVVSEQPGLLLGEEGANKAMVATTGRVKVRVDATKAPIAIGDLLVTSDVPGFAMRSEPLDLGGVQIHRPGTIVGKALEPLASGQGEILVLLSLQ